jgi:hypothetical protein
MFVLFKKMSSDKEDFLTVDHSIPGQNYVCLSFVSPEEVILNKSSFFVSRFLKSVVGDFTFSDEPTLAELKTYKDHVAQLLTPSSCDDKYKDFLFAKQDELEKEYYEQNNFQTSIRGLKVRGVYDTLKEAQHRAKEIQRNDRSFNVYIGQVGYWLPWDPTPQKVANQEYLEEGLNNLVKKYQENQKFKEQHFQENLDYVKEQAAKQADKSRKEKELLREEEQKSTVQDVLNNLSGTNNQQQSSIEVVEERKSSDSLADTLGEQDPWMTRHSEKKTDE